MRENNTKGLTYLLNVLNVYYNAKEEKDFFFVLNTVFDHQYLEHFLKLKSTLTSDSHIVN